MFTNLLKISKKVWINLNYTPSVLKYKMVYFWNGIAVHLHQYLNTYSTVHFSWNKLFPTTLNTLLVHFWNKNIKCKCILNLKHTIHLSEPKKQTKTRRTVCKTPVCAYRGQCAAGYDEALLQNIAQKEFCQLKRKKSFESCEIVVAVHNKARFLLFSGSVRFVSVPSKLVSLNDNIIFPTVWQHRIKPATEGDGVDDDLITARHTAKWMSAVETSL